MPTPAMIDIVLVDWRAPQIALIERHLLPGMRLRQVEADEDVLAVALAETQALAREGGVAHLALIAHGAPGMLHIGATPLSAETLADREGELSALGNTLAPDGLISIYGCQVAAGPVGAAFLDQLQAATGHAVAASERLVGHADLGGGWDLARHGVDGAPVPFPFAPELAHEYRAVLAGAPPSVSLGGAWVVTSGTDTGEGTLRWALEQAEDGDRIIFASTVDTITLTSVLNINKQVTIDGGTAGITLTSSAGIAYVSVPNSVGDDMGGAILENVTLTGFDRYSSPNNILQNQGVLTLRDVAITDSTSTASANSYIVSNGGGTGKLYVEGLTIAGNTVASTNPGGVGVYVLGNTSTGSEIHVSALGIDIIGNTINVQSSSNGYVFNNAFGAVSHIYGNIADLVRFASNTGNGDGTLITDTITVAGGTGSEVFANAGPYTPPMPPPDTSADVTFTEGGDWVHIAPGAVIADDGTHLLSLTVALEDVPEAGALAIRGGTLPDSIEIEGGGDADPTGTLILLAVNQDTGATLADFQAALRLVAYLNDGDDPPAEVTATVTVTDTDGETSDPAGLTIEITGVNDAPDLTADPAGDGRVVVGSGQTSAGLFENAAIDTVEAGQTITELVLTVSGVEDGADEYLVIDGTDVALTDENVVVISSDLTATVSLAGGTATVTIAAGTGLDPQAMAALVEAIAYRNDLPTATGERTVSLTSITDDGGTDAEGQDTGEITGISTTVALQAPPVVGFAAPTLLVTATDDQAYDPGKTLEQAAADGLSLREALGYVQDGDRIAFAEGVDTVTLTSLLSIDKQVTIDGGGEVALTGNGRLDFRAAGDQGGAVLENISLSEFVIADVELGNAFLMMNQGTLTLRNVLVDESSVTAPHEQHQASFVLNASNSGVLYVEGLTLKNNQLGFAPGEGEGGSHAYLLSNAAGTTMHIGGPLHFEANEVSSADEAYIFFNAVTPVFTYGDDLITFGGNVASAPGGSTNADSVENFDGGTVSNLPADDYIPPARGANDESTISFTENDAPIPVAPNATVSDADGNLLSLTLTLDAHDDGSSLAVDAASLPAGITAGYADGVLTLSATDPENGASPAAFQAALRLVTYANDSEDPAASRTITVVATDIDGLASTPATVTVSIATVNDAPQIDGFDETPQTLQPGQTAFIDAGVPVSVTDPDHEVFTTGTLTISIAAGGQDGDLLTLVEGNGVALESCAGEYQILVDTEYVGWMSTDGGIPGHPLVIHLLNATPAQVATLIQHVQFTGTALGARTIEVTVSDGEDTSEAAVAHITVATTPPPPPPPPTDNDGDGIPDAVENLVPGVDGGEQGDGNGDGIPDVEQDDVSSLPWAQTPDGQVRYVTLANDSGLAQLGVSTATIEAGSLPAGLALPVGALAFTVADVPASGLVNFSVFIDSDIPVNGYYKLVDGHWVNIATAITDVGGKWRIDFSIEDGGVFDADGQKNGVIVDPGAPGFFDGDPLDLDGDQVPDLLEFALGLTPGIKDNDVFGRDDLFVMQLYRDVHGREADAGGLAYWQGLLATDALSRTDVALAILGSAEAQDGLLGVVNLVQGLGAEGSLAHWHEVWAAQDGSIAGFADAIVAEKYGDSSDQAYVGALYADVLGRTADTEGQAYWVEQLGAGFTRGEVALAFLASAEFQAGHAGQADLAPIYAGLLGRAGDNDGLAYWSGLLNDGATEAGVVLAFIGSTEYHDRFLPPLEHDLIT